ncbi:MAG: phosphatidylglycerophosphatase A [Candidatus Omnitrophica bacterium]|nr:phosphatidylglycerophosphatase A [Candidatus Omnitrophota bacterium]MCK5259810.1 phosphatidylglycerophosphatase A [Candidatus Omnitrophota bacterium]
MSDKLVKMLSTWFYVGDIPGAPGTAASAVAVLMAVIFAPNIFLYILVTIIVTVLGFKVSGRMEAILGKKDPGCIVIDEVAGIMVAFFLLPLTLPVVITAFFLFRAFDMFKIYPVNKFEEMKGATGVMMDDLIAGLYTNIVMQLAVRWAGII